MKFRGVTDKEAFYHASCYRVYARPTNEKVPTQPQNIMQMKDSLIYGSILVMYLITLKSENSKTFTAWLKIVSDSARVLRQEITDIQFSTQ